MPRELIDQDPLNGSFWKMGETYQTKSHKLKPCTVPLPIHEHGDFILLGNKDLINKERSSDFGEYLKDTTNKRLARHFEAYSKREWLINWCEREMANGSEIEYYGAGHQVGPLAGSGGIYFKYNDAELHYFQTWIS